LLQRGYKTLQEWIFGNLFFWKDQDWIRLILPQRPTPVQLLHGVGKMENETIDRMELTWRLKVIAVVPENSGWRLLLATLHHGLIGSIITD
jgi:hypothetical protein